MKRELLIAIALFIVGGVLAAFWSGYGAYVMVVLDLAAIVVIVVGFVRYLVRRRHRPVTTT